MSEDNRIKDKAGDNLSDAPDRELKEKYAQIEKAKQEWELAADSLSQVICPLDRDGRILRANLAVERWGLGQIKFIKGLEIHELFHLGCADRDCYLNNFWTRAQAELAQGRTFEIEVKDNVLKGYLQIHALPIQIYNYSRAEYLDTFAVLIVDDISERKKAEEKVAPLADLVENAHEIIFVVGADGQIIKSSSLARETFRYSEDEIQALNFMKLFKSEKYDAWKTIVDFLESDSHWRGEFTGMCRNGREFSAEVTFSRPVDIRGKSRSENMICFVRDLTEEKELDRMKGEFISTVSHEIRTPLSIIREGISLILDRIPGEINEKQEELLATAMNSIDRLSRIINDLLDISKIEAGRLELKKRLVDMSDVIRQVAFTFEPKIRNKGLSLRVNCPEEGVNVYGDEDKIIQIFTNLIGNAVRFTEKGYIEISVREREGKIECSVTDTGVGISKENLPKLFSRFQQFGRVADLGEKGTGLGLSIIKNLIEIHGGGVWAESEVDKGSTFTFTLPRYDIWGILSKNIESRIKEADRKESSFSLLIINVLNFKELTNKIGKDEANRISNTLTGEIQKLLRRTSDVLMLVEDHCDIFALLPETGRDGARNVLGRIENALMDLLGAEEIKEIKKLKFSFRSITYPDEAETCEEVIKKVCEAEDE